MVVVSPYAKPGFVDTTFSEHSSVLKFIETVFGLPTLASMNHQFDSATPLANNPANAAPFPPRDGNTPISHLTQSFNFRSDHKPLLHPPPPLPPPPPPHPA